MILHEYTIEVPTRNAPVSLWFLGDAHTGALGFAKNKLVDTVGQIKGDPHSYVIGMGDYCDFIGLRDPRFDPSQIDSQYKVADLSTLADKQLQQFKDILNPVRDRIIGWLEGNHEEKWEKFYHFSPTRNLEAWAWEHNKQCKALSGEALVRVCIKVKNESKARYRVLVYVTHGWGAARTEGADLNKVVELQKSVDADVYAMGHGHKMLHLGYSRVGMMDTRQRGGLDLRTMERPLAFFLTGSYLRTYAKGESGYAARRGYRAVKLGSPRLIMKVTQHYKRANRSTSDELVFEGIA